MVTYTKTTTSAALRSRSESAFAASVVAMSAGIAVAPTYAVAPMHAGTSWLPSTSLPAFVTGTSHVSPLATGITAAVVVDNDRRNAKQARPPRGVPH